MKNKQQIWLPFFLGITMSIGIFLGFIMRDKFPDKGFFSTKQPTTLDEVMYLVEQHYVDKIDLGTIADTIIQSVINKLDPHSEYLSYQELNSLNEQLEGRFSGIGIEFDMIHDTLYVTYVIPDGPAAKGGLKNGDKIIGVDNKKVSGIRLPTDSIKSFIKGDAGSVVEISCLRNNSPFKTAIKRGNIELSSVDAAYMINAQTGYIRLNKFANNTYKEFMRALMELKARNMKNLIFDLRDNGGGILDQAIEIADEFLSDDKLITYTEGNHSPRKNYTCKRQGQFESGQVVVLCNEGSASASEVLMGALQDWDRATIVGQTSFGKGLVQEVFELRDKSALKLTIARYYTPTGRCIQRSYKNGEDAYFSEVANRKSSSSRFVEYDSMKKAGKIYITPKGKKLFGGGGIAPDQLTATDTTMYSDFLYNILGENVITQYALIYVQQHARDLAKKSNAIEFSRKVITDNETWNQFLSFVSAQGYETASLRPTEKPAIEKSIKAAIGRQIWGKEGFFKIINAEDKDISAAMKVLSQ
jgi:carboxyl-terminal processing protease